MKKLILICTLANALIFSNPYGFCQSVGINGISGFIPDPSALLDINTNGMSAKGILIPRIALISSNDASTIATPANSLLVYNLGTGGLAPAGYYYNQGTTGSPNWVPFLTNNISTSAAWSVSGNNGTIASTSAISVPVNNNFIGTTDAKDFVIATNNLERLRVASTGNIGIGTITPAAKFHLFGGDAIIADNNQGNFNVSRTSQVLYLDNIKSWSDNGLRIYDGNSNGHIHIGNVGISYIQSYLPSSIPAGTLGTSSLDFDDNANFGVFALNPLGGNVGIGTITPGASLQCNAPAGGSSLILTDLVNSTLTITHSSPNNLLRFIGNGTTNFTFETGGGERMRIDQNGNIGIGTITPAYTLEVNGITASTSFVGTSDIRRKKNIQTLTMNGLDIINKLRPISFEWKEVKEDGMKGTQMGFIAQELEAILPTIVLTKNDKEQSKGVKYNELLPVLVKGIQEQQKIIEAQQKAIETQQVTIEKLKVAVEKMQRKGKE